MKFGLRWIRRRQHPLTRVVLVLFCAAWLQAAIVPCVMAHAADTVVPPESPAHHQHDEHSVHAGHDHEAMAAGHETGSATHPCLYCPPGDSGSTSCDDHGGCAYPHDPQVDARAAGALFTALPVSFVVPSSPAALVAANRASPAVPGRIPKVSLSVSYCRFIE